MAGTKKKKKPAANPARGFATTSVASKPRPEPTEEGGSLIPLTGSQPNQTTSVPAVPPAGPHPPTVKDGSEKLDLTPEQFERQLEESELQLMVEKHAQKARRDAARQCSRLDTDRRLLRNQAETINIRKWLPPDLMEQFLDLIQAESRFAASSASTDGSSTGKLLPEEDLIIRLWTLQQSLAGAGFSEDRIQVVVRHILDISPDIPSTAKDGVWGLEEAMNWLARECSLDQLPEYESKSKPVARSVGMCIIAPYLILFFQALTDDLRHTQRVTPYFRGQHTWRECYAFQGKRLSI